MKNENHCFGLSIDCKMSAVYIPRSVTVFNHIRGTICKYGMQLHRLVHRIYRQCISNKKMSRFLEYSNYVMKLHRWLQVNVKSVVDL